MDAFNYLSVLLSIIVGLGMTHVLTSAGRLIRGRAHVVTYWPPLVWAAVLLVIYVQVWWSMFGLRLLPSWTFLAFFVVLLQTVTLYMMAALVLPEHVDESEGGVDLRVHYERHAPWFFAFFAATVVVSVVKDLVIAGRLPKPANLTFHIFLFLATTSAILVRRAWYQKTLTLVCAAAVVVYIGALFSRLH